MQADALIGTWKLVSYEVRGADGSVEYPMGRHLMGYVMYTADGFMSATLMRPGRPAFAAPDILLGGTDEKIAAVEGYIAYCGRYELRDDRIVHHVELSLFPNWIGADQQRLVELTADRLVLSTPPMQLGGSTRTAVLIWERPALP